MARGYRGQVQCGYRGQVLHKPSTETRKIREWMIRNRKLLFLQELTDEKGIGTINTPILMYIANQVMKYSAQSVEISL